MGKLSVLLVDDDAHFLKGARDLVAALPCVARVVCASSGDEALTLAPRSQPGLVVTDITMPGMSGFGLIRALRTLEAPPWIVVASLHESPKCRAAMLRTGADGLIAKHEFAAQIPVLFASRAGGANRNDSTIDGTLHGAVFPDGKGNRRGRSAARTADDDVAAGTQPTGGEPPVSGNGGDPVLRPK